MSTCRQGCLKQVSFPNNYPLYSIILYSLIAAENDHIVDYQHSKTSLAFCAYLLVDTNIHIVPENQFQSQDVLKDGFRVYEINAPILILDSVCSTI